MRKMILCLICVLALLFYAGVTGTDKAFGDVSPCPGDFEPDGDVDGVDLAKYALNSMGISLGDFASDFSRTDCSQVMPQAPLNQFNIGDSIGEGEAADGTIGEIHHETVWSTGYDANDTVYSLNERFENTDAVGYYENNADRDGTFNVAVSGATMAGFVMQAKEVVNKAANTPSGKAGMITILLGSNDVCAPSLDAMTDPALFEAQYRAGLDVLVAADATKNAYIHVSSIPAIYWLWNAKRNDIRCQLIWFFVPCENLLDNAGDDCTSTASRLDPDTVYEGDGENCRRRKEFHARIRDIYNPILKDVLQEYKDDGRLPNAYFVDIFDIQFGDIDVNDGDCFHPSVVGHELLSGEEWCRSPWSAGDPLCIH